MKNRLICIFKGHRWDRVHGFYDQADFDAICLRCGKKSETYNEWKKRTHQL